MKPKIAPQVPISTLTRFEGESWLDALLFQAAERDDDTVELAEERYRFHIACGEPEDQAADLTSFYLLLPERTAKS